VVLYESEVAVVYHGRALDVLATMETESVDLGLADPPYGVEWESRHRGESFGAMEGDGLNERDGVHVVLDGMTRVVGQNRHLYVFGPEDVLGGLKVSEPVAMVWNKTVMSGGDLSAPWGKQHEPIWFMQNKHRHAGQTGAKDTPPARMRKGTVLTFPRKTGRKVRHPSEKPVALLSELIESSSRAGELVFDPYAGSGSTGVAAVLLGRRTILVEVDQDFAEMAAKRVEEAERVRGLAMNI
jgi:site-specific DNA-methyltransferase (adenine-specific)